MIEELNDDHDSSVTSQDPSLRLKLRRLTKAALQEEEISHAMAESGVDRARIYDTTSRQFDKILEEAPGEYHEYRLAFDDYTAALESSVESASNNPTRKLLLSGSILGCSIGAALLIFGLILGFWLDSTGTTIMTVGLAVLLLSAALFGATRARATDLGQYLSFRITDNPYRRRMVSARAQLITVIVDRNLIVPALRQSINHARRDRLGQKFAVEDSRGLSDLHESAYRVPTAVAQELSELLEQLSGGSIGIAGPRGAGKSSLMRIYCEARNSSTTADVRCMVSAPVDYVAREFVLLLFAMLCRSVSQRFGHRHAATSRRTIWRKLEYFAIEAIGLTILMSVFGGLLWVALYVDTPIVISIVCLFVGGMNLLIAAGEIIRLVRQGHASRRGHHLRRIAQRNLAKIRYLQTQSASWSGSMKTSLTLPVGLGIDAQKSHGVSRAEQPLSYPEIVREFRLFARKVSQHVTGRGGRVIIGIDELDKIGSAEQAEKFLNEIKSIFGIPQVYFLITVSDDALTAFERRGFQLRDAFDSSFDEIVRVELLSYEESRRLLYRRVIGLTEPYVAFCHALSAGLARDLIRTARYVIRAADLDSDFTRTCRSAVRADVHRKARALSRLPAVEDDARLLLQLHRIESGHYESHPLRQLLNEVLPSTGGEAERTLALRRQFATYIYFGMTLEDIFTEDLDERRVEAAADNSSGLCAFDMLARTRSAMGVNSEFAWQLISDCRRAWDLETCDSPFA
ncbi:hypothetical protein [Microtetraspora niveoalba]|uniref:hypothetical protein n=1 Tax=Microtetraspora niveoalba TaxID=46175 RepID=UPI001C3F1EDC|nr:hypothetical protein [Microtetraspora niveoalba]